MFEQVIRLYHYWGIIRNGVFTNFVERLEDGTEVTPSKLPG